MIPWPRYRPYSVIFFFGLTLSACATTAARAPATTPAATGYLIEISHLTNAYQCDRLLVEANAQLQDVHPIDQHGSSILIGQSHIMTGEAPSLSKMIERGIVSPTEMSEHLQASEQLPPGSITYVGIAEQSGQRAFARVVSGQIVRGHSEAQGQVDVRLPYVKIQLPWMTEFPQVAAQLERTEQTFDFEWGRATNEGRPETMHRLVSILTALTIKETALWGGSLESSYVYVHSTRPANTRLYKRGYGFEEIATPTQTGNPGHSILRRSLASLAQQEISPTFVVQWPWYLARTGSDPVRAFRLWSELQQAAITPYNVKTLERQGVGSIRVIDQGPKKEARLQALSRDFQIPREDFSATNAPEQVKVPLLNLLPGLAQNPLLSDPHHPLAQIQLLTTHSLTRGENLKSWILGVVAQYRADLTRLQHSDPDQAIRQMRFVLVYKSDRAPELRSLGFQAVPEFETIVQRAQQDGTLQTHELDSRSDEDLGGYLTNWSNRSVFVAEGAQLLNQLPLYRTQTVFLGHSRRFRSLFPLLPEILNRPAEIRPSPEREFMGRF